MAYTSLGGKSVGSTVKLNVSGKATEFIVVHQGKPSNIYDDSCNGTWLLMKDVYEPRQWHSSNVNDYANSTIHSYLNSTFLAMFDSNIQKAIKQVKLPYRAGSGFGKNVTSGANGLSAKIFLLSSTEVNLVPGYEPTNEGACLSYFSGTNQSGADTKRVAYLNGSTTIWWLRSPFCRSNAGSMFALCVSAAGVQSNLHCFNTLGIRPALILPSTLLVSDDGNVSTNTAPSTPGSINVPSSIMGGSTITISWAASTDAEGNLAGYIVERSTNGGSSWQQIYQSTATSATNNVAKGTTTVMYRVKAYDNEGLQSGWRTSNQVNVVNNDPPSACPSISVPSTVVGGGKLVVTWSAAADGDGNLSGYILERCINGGSSWTQIFKGNSLSFTDTITKGWTKVKYRVKAYDSYDAQSAYTTSAERTVDNNTAPTITCGNASGSDLGTKSSGFSVNYSVDDVDSADTVTVTEKLDGVVKRTFAATKKATNSFAVTGEYFQKITNGAHTLAIVATDGKKTVTHSLTFTKLVTKAIIQPASPMAADAEITICAINVSGNIPNDAKFKVEVTNNAKDGTPVWDDCTEEAKKGRNHLFTNKTAANGWNFSFRVTVERGASGVGGYITSVQGGFQ